MDEREELVARIMGIQREIQHLFAHDRSDPILSLNLTLPQLKMLILISLRPGAAGQEISRLLGVSLATVTGIVDRLVAQHLVFRREDPRDRRIRRIELTPSGQELIDQLLTAGAERLRHLLDRLTVDQLRIVEQASTLLARAASAELAENTALGEHPKPAPDPVPAEPSTPARDSDQVQYPSGG
ncbi:MAG TPA: MarR family transcriptional regulator [Micromonosporaceae bacterium]